MTRTTASITLTLVLVTSVAAAQDDRAAGLFTEAGQLPLVSQSVVVRINGGDARIELTQVFANDGPELAQADYRLHLPREAVVTGFGFWVDGRFLSAELKERGEARRDHAAAAASGHATALLEHDGSIHAFSVFPVRAGTLQEVEVSFSLPVATEKGRSHVRVPVDAFLGHARLTSGVVVHVESSETLRGIGVDGVRFEERRRTTRSAEIVFTVAEPVSVWWAEEAPPLLVRAESTALDDGDRAVQLRLALNDASLGGSRPRELRLLVDASFSMRRRATALAHLLGRVLDQSTVPVRVVAVADNVREVSNADPSDMVRQLLDGEAGFTTSWSGLERVANAVGCGAPETRCVVVTDPQVDGLVADRGIDTLFLADADELAHFSELVGREAPVFQPGVEPVAELSAFADELVLPVLELRAILQGRDELVPVGSPRRTVAAGGLLRLFVATRSSEPLRLELAIDGRPLVREVTPEALDPSSRLGRAVRRGWYRGQLEDWTADYRRSRDPELRRQIVAVSLRERIPTDLTALQVASPDRVLARTATPAPLLRRVGGLLLALGLMGLFAIRRWS